ncbi:MAG: DNA internalization-related competence protein ComEC/Rec2 [Desulfobulbaceae bacterium]|nr:DNA internalization-related competence protein ComEC/Rec2 [Desulfobulbaceae bacterium]HIJ79982.1 DNA internalization-related competence protein ComEC/Rec2 [Deltaproteobacteria bacterium]
MPSEPNNPLLPVTLSLAAGSACAGQGWLPAGIILWSFTLLLLAATARAIAKNNRLIANRYLSLLFFLTGALYLGSQQQAPLASHHIANLNNKNQQLCLTGTLTTKPITRNNKTKLIIACDSILRPDTAKPQPATGLVQLTVNNLPPTTFEPGRDYCVRTRLTTPRSFQTPGAFDYKRYLADHNILSTGWVADPNLIQPLHPLLPTASGQGIFYRIEAFRQQLANFLSATLNPVEAGLYSALLIGDRSAVAIETLEDFKASGIMHLLAISGMHLGILALLIGGLLTWLLSCSTWLLLNIPVKKTALAATLIPLLFYVAMAGFQIPVVRSFIMVAVFMLAIFSNRQWSSLNNVAIAALIIIIWKPMAITNVAFQLSFAATIAIVITSSRLQSRFSAANNPSILHRAWLYLSASLTVSLIAFLATLPLSLFYFNRLSLLSPLSTLIISPLVCLWALPLGITGVLFLNPAPQLAALIFTIGGKGLALAAKLAALGAALPYVSIRTITPSIAEVIGAYLIMLLILFWSSLPRWKYLVAGGALGLAILPTIYSQAINSGKTSISYLDVGQGSATVIRLADDKTILIDGGGPLSDRFNIGENIIAPFLWKNRITKIDQIILTHLHADHYNGLPFLMKNFNPATIWFSGQPAPDPGFAEIRQLAKATGCAMKIPQTAEQLYKTGQNRLVCLVNMHQDDSRRPHQYFTGNDTNNTGLVVQLTVGEQKFLFPGDIEIKGEELLCRAPAGLASQVLLMPHHGRASSGSAAFLQAVSPEQIIVSAGKPRAKIGAAMLPAKSRSYATTTLGAITLITDGKKISVDSFLQGPTDKQ